MYLCPEADYSVSVDTASWKSTETNSVQRREKAQTSSSSMKQTSSKTDGCYEFQFRSRHFGKRATFDRRKGLNNGVNVDQGSAAREHLNATRRGKTRAVSVIETLFQTHRR